MGRVRTDWLKLKPAVAKRIAAVPSLSERVTVNQLCLRRSATEDRLEHLSSSDLKQRYLRERQGPAFQFDG